MANTSVVVTGATLQIIVAKKQKTSHEVGLKNEQVFALGTFLVIHLDDPHIGSTDGKWTGGVA